MRIASLHCRWRLTWLWFGFATVFGAYLAWDTTVGRHAAEAKEVVSWILPHLSPFLTLILSALVLEAKEGSQGAKTVDRRLFRLTLLLSIVYFGALALPFLVDPLGSGLYEKTAIAESFKKCELWIQGPQTLMSAALGVFFLSSKKSG